MKIAMIGSGATGSVFAAFLRMGGADMWLVDPYKAHMDAIAENGLRFRYPVEEKLVTGFHTAATADGIGIMDIVVILSKTTQTVAAMQGAMPCIGPQTVVLTLQNGLGNVEIISKFVPEANIMYGNGLIGTELPEPGLCIGKPTGAAINIHFGAVVKNELTSSAGAYLEKTFADGGCPVSFDEDIRFFVWRKAIGNISANAYLGLVRMCAGDMWDDPHACNVLEHVLRECTDVATALGMDGESIFKFNFKPQLGNLRNYYSSTAQDMLIYKRKTEIDSLNGAIVEFGRKLGIPTPYNEFITETVKAIEGNYDRQYKEKKE